MLSLARNGRDTRGIRVRLALTHRAIRVLRLPMTGLG